MKDETCRLMSIELIWLMALDNGCINRLEPNAIVDEELVKKLDEIVKVFFGEIIEDIVAGEEGEQIKKYGHFKGYKEIDTILFEIFNVL